MRAIEPIWHLHLFLGLVATLVALAACSEGEAGAGGTAATDLGPVSDTAQSVDVSDGGTGDITAGDIAAEDVDPEEGSDASDEDTNADAPCVVPRLDAIYDGVPNPNEPLPTPPACVLTQHDVILVLGCPTEEDGQPSACQTARANIALSLSSAGYGDRFITSGGAAQNEFVEAESLASLLIAGGVDEADVFVEGRALHTDENLYFATQIMTEQGFTTAVVVSDHPGHLLLAAVCDANCCVGLGRLTIFDFPVSGEPPDDVVAAGHYELYPAAEVVDEAECDHIDQPNTFMCVNLPNRRACLDNFLLEL